MAAALKPLFIHIPKTGGFALRRAPGIEDRVEFPQPKHLPRKYKENLKAEMSRRGLGPQYMHCRWRDLDSAYTEGRRAFAIVRNPWSRVVSQFFFAKKIWSEHPARRNPTSVHPKATFRQFINLRKKWGKEPFFWHRTTVGWYPQKNYVTDDEGNLRCDVLRFEHYQEDLASYLGQGEVPIRNAGPTVDYRKFYDVQMEYEVGEWYIEDLEFFGFAFDGSAERNTWTCAI